MDKLIILFLIFAFITMCEGKFWGITHVKIINGLEPAADVSVHCKSKDDDLGARQLQNNASFQFQFRPNFWGSTQFYCSFVWPKQIQWFDIFKHNRDDCKFCTWIVKTGGPCMYNYTSESFDQCHPWNKKI
ncbi:unnamed protein product [Prunus armeniaca]|uniref:S-protein homolog n=1 Tax=Prunus armeniaca TaxID=36596 RepID=A0A6J5TDH2_PRUAR|nr:unnamed protein product [Prunus armeniaca]CAB4292556.1 unnamed protein product [Prunus armeniaca]